MISRSSASVLACSRAWRIAHIASLEDKSDSDLGLLASFQYTGTGRRVAFNRGGTALNPVVHSSVFDNPIAAWDQSGGPDPDAYFDLNQFGQTRALAYWRTVETGSGTEDVVLAAHRYAHDAAGRRTAVWNQQIDVAPPTGPPVGTNERSQHFAYDALGRLVEADMGKLTGDLDGTSELSEPIQSSDLMPHARRVEWSLDARDTWTLREQLLDGDNDGDANGINEANSNSTTPGEEDAFAAHQVGYRNELWSYSDTTLPVEDRFHNDASGNLILDDDRFYEYDAWGRLVKVSLRGTLGFVTPVPEAGYPELEGAPGRWLVHYTYDALGRLIRKQTPVRDGTTLDQLALNTERYYYDGARRIQEVHTSPIQLDPQPEGLALEEEMELLEGTSQVGIFVDREYVYVPSGASGYVDEFIAQIDRYQDLWYILQNVNYNVIALTDSGGEVVRQHTFDPYGEILTAEDFDTHPGIKIGHQGLFFDRLEPSAPAGGLISMSAAVQLQPGVFGLYQARNRVLLPRYGRWAQKDPNASGMLHASLWHDGQAPSPELATAAMADLLGDGANLFAFAQSSPFNLNDPIGLFGLASALMTGLNLFDTMTDVLDQAEQGVRLGASFIDLIDAYQSELYDMIEWALNPNAAWDEYAYGYTGLPTGGGSSPFPLSPLAMSMTTLGKKGDDLMPGWDGPAWKGHNHGGSSHQNAMKRISNAVDATQGAGMVRFNRALKNPFDPDFPTMRTAEGRSFRPDIQIRTTDGKLLIVEVCVSQPVQSADKKLAIIKNLFSTTDQSKVEVYSLTPSKVDGWLKEMGMLP